MKQDAVWSLWVTVVALVMTVQLLPQTTSPFQKSAKPTSTISYTLKHPLHTVNGMSKEVSSQLWLAENEKQVQQVKVSVPVRSFDSGNRARDKDMRKVTEAEQYPQITFSSSEVKELNGALSVTGLLTFHGVAKEITFTAMQQRQNDELIVTGGFDISLEAYNIKRPALMTMKVKDTLQVKFRMVYPAVD